MDELALKDQLRAFLDANPSSEISQKKLGGSDILAVDKPWGDSSFILQIPEKAPKTLVDALNNVHLPDRLSAIYHNDLKALEVIWTAYALPKTSQEVEGRKFTFRYNGKNYSCKFDEASERVTTLALAVRPIGPTETNYRNLPSFAMRKQTDDGKDETRFGTPKSFWIEKITLTGDDLIAFLSTLNFYVGYYDDLSPIVIIHPPSRQKISKLSEVRYPHSKFPKSINAKNIEPEILHFWSASFSAIPSSKFLYSYRIIEHAAFLYVEDKIKHAVKKALMAPHALDDIALVTEKVIASVRTSKIEDYHKFEHVVLGCVEPEKLWDIVETYIDDFTKEIDFDGGFKLSPLVAGNTSKEEFCNSGVRTFCSLSRKIRNALSHGKEDQTAAVIAPTTPNQDRLRPWGLLMARAAGEVILYQTP